MTTSAENGSPHASGVGGPPAQPREPSVIIDDLHVSYHVSVAGSRPVGAPQAVKRMLSGQGGARPRVVKAVRGVTLMAHRGEAIGVIGHNGSGKTTLLRAIAGLVPADRGRVHVRERPSLLGVDPGLVGDLTGERNVLLGLMALGMSAREAREHFDEVARFAGLGEALERPLRTYSTGMTQRLRFAITTAAPHDVLLIDEALATGDAEFRRRSAERLEELRAEAGTVFLVSHSLSAVLDSCERAVWLDSGTVRKEGPAAEIVAAYRDNERDASGTAV